jgi:hypothetical protein
LPEPDAIRQLTVLLAEVGARPTFAPERIAPSTLYDTDYHLAVVACAFFLCAKVDVDGRRQILAPWLKLLQFVAARPRLVSDLRVWVSTRRNPDLDTWRRMPRGYVGDRTHDAIIEFLVASGILEREKDQLMDGPRVAALDRLYEQLRAANLFAAERQVLAELLDIRANKTMLEGA